MKHQFERIIQFYTRRRKQKRFFYTVVAILALIILGVTSAALMAPAVAQVNPQILVTGEYTVWVDPSNGSNPFYKGVDVVKYENVSQIILPTAAEIGSPSDYAYTVRAWYDIATKTKYEPGDTITVEKDMVLYADWVASSYNIGEYIEGHSVESLDTSDFIKVQMFDYNDLVNLNTAILKTSRADGADWESWSAIAPEESGYMPINTWRDVNNYGGNHPLDFLAYSGDANGIYQGGTANIFPGLYNYGKYYFDDSNLGVDYIGEGNYLFQYSREKGYYFFDSHLNGAAYNQSEQRFYIYDAPSKTTCTDSSGAESQGDFLPFNLGHGTDHSNYIDHDGTKGAAEDANYWFGMKVSIDFYLPAVPGTEDGNAKNIADKGNPMIYYFSGDDDIWIFLDGVLVLDLGGIHEPVSGFINFANGRVCTTDSTGSVVDTTLEALIPGFSAGDHKIEIYYMERGGGLANCSMYFNLPARQNLQIDKMDRQDPDASMAGTKFTVFQDENCTEHADDLFSDPERTVSCDTFTIDSSNQATLYGFYCDKPYYIKETAAPEGYTLADRVLEVIFNYDGTMTVTPLPENTLPGYDGNIYAFVNDNITDDDNLGIVTVYNAKTTDDLTLRKIWYTSDGTVDTGKTDPVTVDVYRTTDTGTTLDILDMELYKKGVVISDLSDGVLTFVLEGVEQYAGDGDLYYYYIVEQPVEGYSTTYINNGVIAGGTITVANVPGDPVEYNRPTFTLTKKDDKKNLLPGAVFRLYEYSNTARDYVWLADYTVGEDGTIVFHDELKYNTAYYLEEIKAPAGYLKNTALVYFGVAHKDTVLYPTAAPAGFTWSAEYEAEVVNYGKPSVTLEKVDDSTRELLAGAKFELYRWNGTNWVIERMGLITGDDGTLKLDGLEYNTAYKIVEVTAPTGYILDDQIVCFRILAVKGSGIPYESITIKDTEIKEYSNGGVFQVENKKMPSVTLTKMNQDKTLALSGAVFDLYLYRQGSWVRVQQNVTTGSDGTVLLDQLSYNKLYRLTETKAPEGYEITEEHTYFWIPVSNNSQIALPEGVTAEDVQKLQSGDDGYVLTILNNKIPSLSVVKKWYEKDENGEIAAVTDASGYNPVNFTLYQHVEYSPVQSEANKLTINLTSWNGNYYYSTDSLPAGTTVTISMTRRNVPSYGGKPSFLINEAEISYTCEEVWISGENSWDKVYDRTYTLIIPSISGEVTLGGALNSYATDWDAPVFSYEYSGESNTPDPENEFVCSGTLSAENGWRYDHLSDLKTSEEVNINGQTYLAVYTYYVVEDPVPGYDVSYVNNDLDLSSDNKVITIENRPNNEELTSLTITKVDSGTQALLADAEFTLYKWDGSDWAKVNVLTTGGDGTITFVGLSYNTAYKLEETSAPYGYSASGPWYYYFPQDDTTTYPEAKPDDNDILYSDSTSAQIKNTPKTVSLTVKKIWNTEDAETSPVLPAEITFELYRKTLNGGDVLDDSLFGTYKITAANGWTLKLYDLPATGDNAVDYVYYVKEVSVPGFSTEYSGQDAAPGPDSVITITNTPIPSYELPATGGPALAVYVLGALLTVFPAVLLADRKRRAK